VTATRRFAVSAGNPEPLGVTPREGGVNVGVVSTTADAIDVCLFDERGEREIARLPLRRASETTFCGFVAGIGVGARYGLRADGRYDPAAGHWFDPAKLLVDPYATALDRPFAYDAMLSAPQSAAIDTAALVPKAIVMPAAAGLASRLPPGPPGFIYEIAVKAFTRNHPAVPERLRGTVAALGSAAVIDHLVRLGVDTVELMPIAAWIDERHLHALGLSNAWGYNPVAFMAPDPRLAPGGIGEVREAVAALHAAGMRVILDVVFNHTGEGDERGPTLSLRGLDSALYYRHAADDPGRLVNDTGTGNTLAADRPRVVRLICDALRHWVTATGVDGFRFDLAATLGRADDGFRSDAPVFAAIDADPVLSGRILIAEPWDVGPGGYRLGQFPRRWREWNDRFRDDMRRFWRGDGGTLANLATRLAGSADAFAGRAPSAGVNFVAAHDGFTLADLVAYADRHNQANGEANRDGAAVNFSWNNGIEGETDDAAVNAARARDVRALLATVFVAGGIPMLTAGDELGRTQHGNNNAYAQDNEVTWLDWAAADVERAAFVARLAATRKAHRSLRGDSFLTGEPVDASGIPDVMWLKPEGGEATDVDWREGRAVGMALYVAADGAAPADRTLVWINGGNESRRAWLPPVRDGCGWRLDIDSSRGWSAIGPRSDIAIPPRSVLVFCEIPRASATPDS
jgi:glycogen operon protein